MDDNHGDCVESGLSTLKLFAKVTMASRRASGPISSHNEIARLELGYSSPLHYLLYNVCKPCKERKKVYAGCNQRALRKDPTVSAVTDHESHQYLN
eukprot:1137874-Pelagomonas_calceolata.AAC.1